MLLNVKSAVYAALSTDASLVGLVKGGIYPDKNPDAGTYPAVVYTEISNIPHMHADDAEQISKSTIQISILTEDGASSAIAERVNALMLGVGFMRVFSGDLLDGNIKITSMRYVIAQ